MRLYRLVIVSLLFSILCPGIVEACSCIPFIGRGAADSVVVSGRIDIDVEAGATSPWGEYSRRLIAEKVWFGPNQREFRLVANRVNAGCESAVNGLGQPGDRVIAWLQPFGGDYHSVGSCSLIGWEDKDREAVEESLRDALAAYDSVDRSLLTRPDNADLWRARLKIATDLNDVHGRLLSLRRLVELAPDIDLLRDAAATAYAVHDGEAAQRYANRGLILAPGDDSLSALRQRTVLRRAYNKDILARTDQLDGLTWANQREGDVRLEGVRLRDFQIRDSAFSGLIVASLLSSGLLLNTSFSRMTVRRGSIVGVLMRNVRLSHGHFDETKIEAGRISASDFSHTVFSGASIEGTEIENTTFRSARLTKVQFAGAHLADVDFGQASLSDVEFVGTGLVNIDFTAASLERVHFRDVRLRNVDLATVVGLHITAAIVDCRTRLPTSLDLAQAGVIIDARECEGRPTNRDFTSAAYASRWHWTDLDLTAANFTGVNLDIARFHGSILSGARFSRARIRHLGGYKVDFRDARFTGAIIGDSDFRLADLRGTDFTDANLTIRYAGAGPFRGAKYDARTKWPATFLDGSGKVQPFKPAEQGAILVKD